MPPFVICLRLQATSRDLASTVQSSFWCIFSSFGRPASSNPLHLAATLNRGRESELLDCCVPASRAVRFRAQGRDSLSSAGDISASHSSNVEGKKKLATLVSRVGALAQGIETLAKAGMSGGELTRRGDSVSRLQDECAKLGEMVVAARASSARQTTFMANMDPAPTADRVALLGATNAPITRVFGSRPRTPQETEQTRPLDDRGVLQYQQLQITQQDTQLTQLSTILQRQMQLGVAIGSEIEDQNRMLDDLASDVDRTGAKLGKARKQLGRLEGK
ncbi:hypothetical protein CALCODRAFT_557890 [Calocera cornea HHB12733]|uniref:t-SNARE coiled-coil homology domain-containing protein n=1 Tax=Calocera cornea HHB12733 TaxID=1353952 RepID=A0A165DGX2_9BASI|nr:hypothetical protein CALCODRAFT_557890 [Calocera cornea HHB12733]